MKIPIHLGIVAFALAASLVGWFELGLIKRLLAHHDSNAVIITELAVSLVVAIAYASYRANGDVGKVASQVGSLVVSSWRSLLFFSLIGFGLTLVSTHLVGNHGRDTITVSQLAAGVLSIIAVLATGTHNP